MALAKNIRAVKLHQPRFFIIPTSANNIQFTTVQLSYNNTYFSRIENVAFDAEKLRFADTFFCNHISEENCYGIRSEACESLWWAWSWSITVLQVVPKIQKWWFWCERGRPHKNRKNAEFQAILDENDGQMQQKLAEQLNMSQKFIFDLLRAIRKIQNQKNTKKGKTKWFFCMTMDHHTD